MSTRKHYFRAGHGLSWPGRSWQALSGRSRGAVWAGCALLGTILGLGAAAFGQYPGQVQTKPIAPVLRAVAVLEWTGAMGKPTFSRLVPITIFDGQTLQDGGIYLARPAPLGLDSGTEYILENNGLRVGLFDVDTAGEQQGTWMGFGKWKPMPHVKPTRPNPELAKVDFVDESSDKPILHRKHHPGETQSSGSKSGGNKSGGNAGGAPAGPAPAPDSDRPVLHRTSQSGDASGEQGSAAGPAPAPDPDRPTLTEPKKHKKATTNDVAYVSDLPDITDPGRPRLLRGKPAGEDTVETPELKGLPPEVHQAVAVSDAESRPEHVWSYRWANAGDEMKMKSELEAIARDALGLTLPPPKPEPKTKKGRRRARPAVQQLTLPAALHDEQFRVFELAYGSGATMVFSADTGGPLKDEKFVTLIGQPDLYGNVAILKKHVSDGAHLDDSPRMRLVDAVDAMADNRGELLFELQGASGRQFVLYRVLHGQVEKLFTSAAEWFGRGADGAGPEGPGSDD
ncbi:MAG TPA: hypothetical protein VND90_04370 [Terracidiphilus sp.]|nr:hypothetical protein [Terracidiphilus sp.]